MLAIVTSLCCAVSKGFKAIAEHGILYCTIFAASYLYLLLLRRMRKRRFDLYDVFSRDDPEKLAFFAPKLEWELETPQEKGFLKQSSDGVRCSGVNSKSEFIHVSVFRKTQDRVHCSLVLRLANGNTYYLPDQHVVQKDSNEMNTFGSARIKLECLSPMRRWRIFFNGLLWEKCEKEHSSPELKHVKFAFSWVASSAIFDYNSDLPLSLLAHLAAVQTYDMRPFYFIEKLMNNLNGYTQSGMFIGEIEVQDRSSEEVYLWGYRNRVMGSVPDVEEGKLEELFVNAENGTLILLKTINITGKIPEFHYGHVMQANGQLQPIESLRILKEAIICTSNDTDYKIQIVSESKSWSFLNSYHGETMMKSLKVRVNDMPAYGISSVGIIAKRFGDLPLNETSAIKYDGRSKLTLPINISSCKNTELSGGKGSSLSILHSFSQSQNKDSRSTEEFSVPRAVVVTTTAYELFTAGSLATTLQRFEKALCLGNTEKAGPLCESVKRNIVDSNIPENVVESLRADLIGVFGKKFAEMKFAVRSSATGEDTEQLSAAGQMETYLGVKGFDEILNAVKKCWASQFGFVAVQYKRRYGQLVNSPMAVVVQEMVPCDVAGVMFTCDPVTGNPTYVTISANYGLGESVVSATSEPDTIVLKRNLKNELEIYSKEVGSKKTKTVVSGTDGIEVVNLDEGESSVCCLNDEMALQLAKISVQVETHYGNPRDIEWGILGDKIFLLQSRPITSISIETDFEIKHSSDSYIRREDEYTTKANVGEVFSGSTSPLGSDSMLKFMQIATTRCRHLKGVMAETTSTFPYCPTGVTNVCGHFVFQVADAFFRFSESKGNTMSDFTKAMSVGFFGRVVEDKKLFEIAVDRHHSTSKRPLVTTLALPLLAFLSGFRNRRIKQRMENVQFPIKKTDSAEDILYVIASHFHNLDISVISHFECTVASSFWNMNVLTLLAKEEGAWNNNVYGDFGYLLSTCHDVESADVPASNQHLGYVISHSINPSEFKKMSPQAALQWLCSTQTEAGNQFQQFMAKHGHRGINEFDIQVKTWMMNPKPLIDMLQNIVSEDAKDATQHKLLPTSEVISKLKIKLGFLSRLKLRFLLPHCQRCVREREFSKSVLIHQFQKKREAYRLLGKTMVKEGRLPDEELVFYLNVEEIRVLLKTRSPRLLSVAYRRRKVHPELNKLIFPEISTGIPKPISTEEVIPDAKSDLIMAGVPVSHGTVTARACVILSVKEASTIQAGDILITYATDIGWSPYFPLLSGIVTELGGLVSHGAVVAREYGLPCVVNLHGASRRFKTGDLVLLDGNKGILKRLKCSAS